MTSIESGQLVRYDILVLGSGMSVAAVRDRLELVESADPVTLIPRQAIGSVTWHRVGFDQLQDAINDADPDALLSTLLTLDALNKVPQVYEYELSAEDPPYGVVMMGTEVIGFSEGPYLADRVTGQKRGATREAEVTARSSETANMPPHPATRAAASEMPDNGDDEPTRFGAYPVIEAPVTIDPDESFEVSVGVDAERMRHTVSEGIEVADLDPYVQTVPLKVMLTSPGFEIVGGSDELPELKIDRATLDHAPVVIRLRSIEPPPTYDPAVGVWTARLTATFFYEGTIVGDGYREVRVNQGRTRHAARESDRTPVMSVSQLPLVTEGTDITIAIEHEDGTGNFSVRVSSQHLDEPVPAGRIILGQDANSFAAVLVREVESSFANQVSDETLGYIGERIAGKMPAPVLDAIGTVWDKVNGPGIDEADRRIPDLLLLTDEWAIPWELMNVTLDETKPPYLGAQLNVGRWPYQFRDRLDSAPLGIKGLGVMIGHYPKGRKIKPLERAEEEGRELARQYEATMVDADPATLDQLLTGEFEGGFTFEALHFAGHGMSDPDSGTYLMYSDGNRMSVFALGRASVAKDKRAFVFVNACQVGTAEEMLGEYAGLAGTAIHAGFRGFVAPLWSVSDVKAKEVSLGLYEASAEGRAISEYLRGVRAGFVQTETEVAHTTYMAYVFYGHPRLRLGGPDERRQS